MTADIIPFPYNDHYRPDEQRQHVGPATLLMEAQALIDAITLYRDAKGPGDEAIATRRMTRLLEHGSPAAREAAIIWMNITFGPPAAAPEPVDHDPFEGVPGYLDGWLGGSDYAD